MPTAELLAQYITTEIMQDPGYDLEGAEPLISGGLIDSFSLVDLALYIEETFGVKIHDSELNADTFDTLEALTALVDSRK